MKAMARTLGNFVVAAAMCAALVALPAVHGQSPENRQRAQAVTANQPAANPRGTAERGLPGTQQERLTVKVFELKRVDPGEASQALNAIWSPTSNSGASQRNQNKVHPAPRMAVDAVARTLFVRGSPEQVHTASEVIDALNDDSGKNAAALRTMRIISLRHATPEQVIAVLTALGWQNNVVALQKSRMLLVRADADADDIGAVVEKLDHARKTDNPRTAQTQTHARTSQRPHNQSD
jgi:hypothetical protein